MRVNKNPSPIASNGSEDKASEQQTQEQVQDQAGDVTPGAPTPQPGAPAWLKLDEIKELLVEFGHEPPTREVGNEPTDDQWFARFTEVFRETSKDADECFEFLNETVAVLFDEDDKEYEFESIAKAIQDVDKWITAKLTEAAKVKPISEDLDELVSGEVYTVEEAMRLRVDKPEIAAAIGMSCGALKGVNGINVFGELRTDTATLECTYRVERDKGEAEIVYGPTQHRLNRITEDLSVLHDKRRALSGAMQTKVKELPELRQAVENHTTRALAAMDDPKKIKQLGDNPMARAERLSLQLMGKAFADIEDILMSDAQASLDQQREYDIVQRMSDHKLEREEAEAQIPQKNAEGLSDQAREVGEACIELRKQVDEVDAEIKALNKEEVTLLESRLKLTIVRERVS
jgi:hypothetical protein